MATIKAPFNFVPVSEKVFFPDWADKISHDIPFEDGESGVIELKITAESPIFVRNGHTKADGDAKNETYKSFSKVDNRYFIPATTIKGAIRNVLEIMSFGKMAKVDDDSFGVRDISNQPLGIDYRNKMKNQHCGWLRYTNDGYILQDCGIPGRIPISAVDKKYGTKLEIFAKEPANFKKDAGRTAKAKYDAIGAANFLKQDFFTKDTELDAKMKAKNPIDPRFYVKFGGDKKGTLVLTGQPGVRRNNPKTGKGEGKFYEFVFFESKETGKKVDERVVHAFKTVHKSSPDFTEFWGKMLNHGEKIPVFFQYENVKENGKERIQLHSIGLSYLYKYPYDKSVSLSIPKSKETQEKWNRPDLSECIFGYTEKNNALKGRVQFSAAFSDDAEEDTKICLILGSPKASYYPLYVRQTGRNGRVDEYQTYNKGTISGWKRYLLREHIWEHSENSETLDTVLYPLKKGSTFSCKIRYHNLKKVELGALLSALSFHNMQNCFHQIGQAKPYGFGKIRIDFELSDNQKELIKLFEETIRKELKEEWRNTEQMRELFTLASVDVGDEDKFKYMKMSNDRDSNEFLKVKAEKLYLQKYTEIAGKSIVPDSDLLSLKKQLENEYTTLIEKAKSLKEQEKYEEAKSKLAKAEKLFEYKSDHITLLSEINNIIAKQAKAAEEQRQKAIQAAKDKEKVEGGLAFLEEKNLQDKYKVVDFKGAKSRIDQWLKKANASTLPKEQLVHLKTTIDRLRQNPVKGEDWTNYNSNIWRTLQSYIGEQTANQWFNNINK